MEAKQTDMYLHDYNSEDRMTMDENNLLEQLKEEAGKSIFILCYKL